MRNFRILLLMVCFVMISCEKSDTDPITELPEGVELVNLNGLDQAINVRGNDMSKPLILILHGGPGYAMMPLFHILFPDLEDHYIVVNWDQRGAGLSYNDEIPESSMTYAQIIDDAHKLTLYLKSKYGKSKINLIGHSWGTMLGIELIKKYPEDYNVYIGTGQVANVVKNEQGSYDFALQKAKAANNQTAISELESVGRPNNSGEYLDDSGGDVTMKWVGYYGGDLFGKQSSDEIDEILLADPMYKDYEDYWLAGSAFSANFFNDPAVWAVDFPTTHNNLTVPVIFFMGSNDYDTPAPLMQEYFNTLVNPSKTLVWFEQSAHFSFYEEPAKFKIELLKAIPE